MHRSPTEIGQRLLDRVDQIEAPRFTTIMLLCFSLDEDRMSAQRGQIE